MREEEESLKMTRGGTEPEDDQGRSSDVIQTAGVSVAFPLPASPASADCNTHTHTAQINTHTHTEHTHTYTHTHRSEEHTSELQSR